jgi:hypothetical protein
MCRHGVSANRSLVECFYANIHVCERDNDLVGRVGTENLVTNELNVVHVTESNAFAHIRE